MSRVLLRIGEIEETRKYKPRDRQRETMDLILTSKLRDRISRLHGMKLNGILFTGRTSRHDVGSTVTKIKLAMII